MVCLIAHSAIRLEVFYSNQLLKFRRDFQFKTLNVSNEACHSKYACNLCNSLIKYQYKREQTSRVTLLKVKVTPFHLIDILSL